MAAEKESALKNMATKLAGIVEKTFKSATPPINLAENPLVVERYIIEYEGRMRVSGMEIFNGPTFISAINFYRSSKEQEENKACGAIVIYFEAENTEPFLRALGHKNIDEDDVQTVLNACGAVCKTIAERFKSEMGFSDLILSAPKSFHNYVPSGIDFSYDQYQKFEISFFIKAQKILAVDLTMSGK